MALRDYAQSRSMIENTESKDLKMTPSIERVLLTQIELSREED